MSIEGLKIIAETVDTVGGKGRMVFSNGEPYLVMMPAKAPPQTIPIQDNSLFLLYAVSGFTATIPITYLIHKKRSSRRPKESDLDTIISIIRKHGKVVYQSQIVRESGLSKSTVSTILKTLESEGRVVRTREGRENMVKLIR
ncbi:MAG: MarR family transcriptional regulator [Nitrososphaerota archaeon]